jgi:hypothetical protein
VNAVNGYESRSDQDCPSLPSLARKYFLFMQIRDTCSRLYDRSGARCDAQSGNKVLSYSIPLCNLRAKNERRGILSMKRLTFALSAALLLGTVGPLPTVSARDWWWHHHSNPGPAGVGANSKVKRTKTQRGSRVHGKLEALYNSPKSVGWWHKGPGPMGAGTGSAGTQGTKTARHEKHHKEKSARSSSHRHWYSAWFHRRRDSSPTLAASGAGSK